MNVNNLKNKECMVYTLYMYKYVKVWYENKTTFFKSRLTFKSNALATLTFSNTLHTLYFEIAIENKCFRNMYSSGETSIIGLIYATQKVLRY